VSDSGGCGPSEAALAWSQTGPAGAPGPAGPPAPSGTLAWAHVAPDGRCSAAAGT
jgi:hypothetical protein